MIFDNCRRRISEITDQELKDFIGNQEENQWIDFKLLNQLWNKLK